MSSRSGIIYKGMVIQTLLMSLFLVSCKWRNSGNQYDYGKTPLVEVNGDVLYAEDLKQVLPIGYSKADSTVFAQRYIKNWVQDQLFYQNAIRNIPDTKDIDRLVENYRRSLFEHEYERRLIAQTFSSEITDDEIASFYTENSRLFELDESLIRGIYIKVSNKAHDLAQIRSLYARTDDESFEGIEKYCIRNSARCEFFYDNWRTVTELETQLPPMELQLETLLQNNRSFEFSDQDFIYLLNVSEFAAKGDIEPLDHARARIRGLLINSNEVSYMRKIKEDLYEAAIDKNRIIFHYKDKQ